MINKPGTWISITFVLLALVSMFLYLNEKLTLAHEEEIIYEASGYFRTDLKDFLQSVENTVNKLKEDVNFIQVDELPVDSLNRYFSEMTGKRKLLHGVLLFGDHMNYVLFRDKNSWVYTHNNLLDSLIDWQRIDKNLQPIPHGNWTETYNNFMDESNFGSANELLPKNETGYLWRAASSTLPDRHDLIFNVFRIKTGNDIDVAALIYKTSELSSRFSRVLIFENPLVSIVTSKENIVSPIRTNDTSNIKAFRILEDQVKTNFHTWKNTFEEKPHTFTFAEFNKNFYSRFDTIKPQLGINAFALTISKNDIDYSKQKLVEAYLYATILLFLFALFAFINTYNNYRKKINIPEIALQKMTADEAELLITGGETESVEFKSSLRWDYRDEKVNKTLEEIILKSIAAFSNAKGGILFIGVSDDLEIIGLEPDFKTLKKHDADFFELHLRKLINNQYGFRYSNKHLLIHFPEIDGKQICVIQIASGDNPLYLKVKNKQGQEVEKFYVRSGNASQEIGSLKEINEYVKSRFESS